MSSLGKDRPRVIGTLSERIALYQTAGFVLSKMEDSGLFSQQDLDSLQSVILGFLREPEPRLLGYCSYSKNHKIAKNAGERTWRILVKRSLLYSDDGELCLTLYHEFLHGILGPRVGHGPLFQSYEEKWHSIRIGSGRVSGKTNS